MDYKLCKKLKDAGFRQNDKNINGFRVDKDNFVFCWCGTCQVEHYTEEDLKESVTCPTLSELIEACGDEFATLLLCGCEICKWNCHGRNVRGPHQDGFDDDDWARPFNGKTPEEAVANLYLELHK